MFKKFGLSIFVAATLSLAACGGGGGSEGSNTGSGAGGSTGQATPVSGPLDTVQSTLSQSVFNPLEDATAGTPLQSVLMCTNVAVNGNVLDILDAVLNGLQNPGSLSTTAPAQVQAQLLALTQNLQSLLTSFAGGSACGGAGSGSGGLPAGNPLAGTPLAPLGDALIPVLQQIQQTLGSSGGSSGSGPQGFATLAALVNELNSALQSAVKKLPASATSAPIVGGAIATVESALTDLDSLLNGVASNDSAAVQTSVQDLIDHVLVNVLTQVVPTSFIENQAGKPGVITGPVDAAAAKLSAAVAAALATGTTPLVDLLNSSQLAPVLDPIENLLPAILNPIASALAGISSGTSAGGPTGTPLDNLLTPLETVLQTILGTSGGTSCIFANIPVLSGLCKIIP